MCKQYSVPPLFTCTLDKIELIKYTDYNINRMARNKQKNMENKQYVNCDKKGVEE